MMTTRPRGGYFVWWIHVVSLPLLLWYLMVMGSCQIVVALGKGTTASRRAHTNNWAVIVSTSTFWYNYRHTTNALAFYDVAKKGGIPDSQIILMLADDIACNERNIYPGTVFKSTSKRDVENLYTSDVEIDYRGPEVTPDNFMKLLTGRQDPSIPMSKRLNTDENSNIMVFLTGHGGDGFFKFQEIWAISDYDVKATIEEMKRKKRFNEMLWIADTCQASTLFRHLSRPDVATISSSRLGENSYAIRWRSDDIGLSTIDGFSNHATAFLEDVVRGKRSKRTTLKDLLDYTRRRGRLMSTPIVGSQDTPTALKEIALAKDLRDFVTTAVVDVDLISGTAESYSITESPSQPSSPAEALSPSLMASERRAHLFVSSNEQDDDGTGAWLCWVVGVLDAVTGRVGIGLALISGIGAWLLDRKDRAALC